MSKSQHSSYSSSRSSDNERSRDSPRNNMSKISHSKIYGREKIYDKYGKRSESHSRSRSSSRDEKKYTNNRGHNRSRSSSRSRRIKFDYEIFIEKGHVNLLTESDEKILRRIRNESRINRIFFDNERKIPDLDGSVLMISDDSQAKKYSALLSVLQEIKFYEEVQNKNDSKEFSVIILVPEGMVSLLIGSKGRQINSIMKESNTNIIVNQPIHKMTYRTVKIDGTYSRLHNIAKACQIIYSILEERSPNVDNIERVAKPLAIEKTKTAAKLVFLKASVGFIIGKEGSWIKNLCEKCGVSIKFQQDAAIRCVKKDEAICSIHGKLQGVIDAVVILLRRAHDFENASKVYSSDVIKLLIPNNFVTKLIGAKGCMIREIAAKAGGAQIKILSDKQSEKEFQECIVAIAGSLANKQDAACYILEQIETFKNGGPILLSGRSINDNLAQQFRNSVPIRENLSESSHEKSIEIAREWSEEKPTKEKTERPKIIEKEKEKEKKREPEIEPPKANLDKERDRIQLKDQQKDVKNTIIQKNDIKVEAIPTIIPKKAPSEERITGINSAISNNKELDDKWMDIIPHNYKKVSRSRSRSKSRNKRSSRSPKPSKYRESSRGRGRSNSSSKVPHTYGSDRRDVTKNSHYIDSRGERKIHVLTIVPSYLVPYLIGKNGEVIKTIVSKTRCYITFHKENDLNPVNTNEGIRGRFVSFIGTPKANTEAFGLLLDEIIKLEANINGYMSY